MKAVFGRAQFSTDNYIKVHFGRCIFLHGGGRIMKAWHGFRGRRSNDVKQ